MSEQLRELARQLVTPERFGDLAMQDTVEIDTRVVLELVWDAEIEAEKARILESRDVNA